MSERERNPLLHHKVKGFETQLEVFEKITAASAVLGDPLTAFAEIDRVLEAAVRYKRPVYLEVPRDRVSARQVYPHRTPVGLPPSDPDALREALDEAAALLTAAQRPMILADVEIHRFGLQDDLIALAEQAGLPIATTILGKSVISEGHPLFAGVYEGGMGRAEVTAYVEASDCLLMLGCFLTDINLGIFTANLDPSRCIDATSEDLRIRHHHYQGVRLDDFVRGLRDRRLRLARPPAPPRFCPFPETWAAQPGTPVTTARLFARLNRMLDDRMVVIADIGDALFGAADMTMSRRTEFLGPAYYTSMGFSVPAAVGAGVANRALRPLVIVGDGAFQMTGMELSTVARQGLNPIVVVMNNKGYTTERFLLDGPFNDIHEWAYHKVPELLGAGLGLEVRTEDELDSALTAAAGLHLRLQPAERPPRPVRQEPRPGPPDRAPLAAASAPIPRATARSRNDRGPMAGRPPDPGSGPPRSRRAGIQDPAVRLPRPSVLGRRPSARAAQVGGMVGWPWSILGKRICPALNRPRVKTSRPRVVVPNPESSLRLPSSWSSGRKKLRNRRPKPSVGRNCR